MGRTCLENPQATNGRISRNTNCNSEQIMVKANEHSEWLPDGWIVEVRTQKSGVHMGSEYKCYTEPSNGHRFYSKPEVLRYLETVKGYSCTSKMEKRCTNLHSPGKPSSAAKRQKPKHSAAGRQLFIGEEISDSSSLKLLDTNSSTGVVDMMSAEIMVVPVRTDETVANLHLQEDVVADPSETNEKSNPGKSALLKLESLKESEKMFSAYVGLDFSPAADLLENLEKDCIINEEENGDKKNQGNPSLSRNEKELLVRHRFSKRLAGIEPSQVADPGGPELALQVPKKNLRKSRRNLANKSSEQFNVVPEIEVVQNASCMNMPMQGESLSKSHKPSEEHGAFREQQHMLETKKIDDNKPEELKYSVSQDSSSLGINMAINSIVAGELPVLASPVIGHSLASKASVLTENELHVSKIGKSGDRKIRALSSKSSNKKNRSMPSRASKRLAGFEPELINNSIYSDKPPEYKSRKSKSEVNKVAQQSEGGAATELADHDPAK